MDNRLFETPLGKKIYASALSAISDYSMDKLIRSGVLVGFSGGADSVMLLEFLLEYRKRTAKFPIVAVHVNHMIREGAADLDEEFSREYAKALGVEFISVKLDVPSLAKKTGLGIEEAARNARYSAFRDIICGRNDIGAIAVAHNSTDNLETVIFNLMRGAGVSGISGISPVRGNIVRPLIYSSSEDIREALGFEKIKFVTDKTNFDTEYTRNYIRHEIIPRLGKIVQSPEESAKRVSSNLRSAAEFISSYARDFICNRSVIPRAELAALSRAPFAEVMRELFAAYSDKMLEASHIEAIRGNLDKDNFKISLPDTLSFIAERGECRIGREALQTDFSYPLTFGENEIPEFSARVFVETENHIKTYSKVYNFSIQAAIPFDIIKGELFIRNRREGDTFRVGGMTKKVKRMLCDADIPSSVRGKIPFICDSEGILWIPGLGVRDGYRKNSEKTVYITLVLSDSNGGDRFYIKDCRASREKV